MGPSPSALLLCTENRPADRALAGPRPVPGASRHATAKLAGSAPGPQAQRSPALICLEFSNKETCGREEGGREGYRGGRPSGRMIQPPSPATRGQAGGEEEEGQGSGCRRSPAGVCKGGCQG